MAPQNRNTQIGKAKEGKQRGSLAYYIILRSLNIISKSKLNRQTQKEKQRKGERKDLSLCLFVCPVPVAVELGEITRFIMIQSDCSLCSVPAPPRATLCRPQLVWFTSELALCGIRENQTETERYRDRDSSSSKSKLWQEVQAGAKSKSSFSMQSELEKASSMRRHATQKASQ